MAAAVFPISLWFRPAPSPSCSLRWCRRSAWLLLLPAAELGAAVGADCDEAPVEGPPDSVGVGRRVRGSLPGRAGRGRLESQPPEPREVQLRPGMRVVGGDLPLVVADGGAGGEAVGDPGRDVEQPGEHRHRERELLAVAALGDVEEPGQVARVEHGRGLQRVLELPVGQPVLQRHRLVERGLRPALRDDRLGQGAQRVVGGGNLQVVVLDRRGRRRRDVEGLRRGGVDEAGDLVGQAAEGGAPDRTA